MVVQIDLGNSYSKISGLTAQQEKDLSKELSYVVGGSSAYYSGFGPKRKSLLDKRGNFPTGLLERLTRFLDKGKLPYVTVHTNNRPGKARKGILPRFSEAYPWQRDALHIAAGTPRGAIQAPTGSGKSKCMAMFAEGFGIKTLWIVPSLEIKAQTIKNWSHLRNVTITNIDDPALQSMTDFDMLLIDECHRVAAKTYHKLNKTAWTKIYYRYNFSATTFRNDEEETLLYESIAGPTIYKLSYKEAVAKGYIVPIDSYYIEIPTKKNDLYSYREVYNELVVNNDTANEMIAQLLVSLKTGNCATLCMVREVKHGQILADLTGYPFVNGQDEDSRQYIQDFNSGKIKVLIGTEQILGEGVDTKPCEYVVIAGSGKAKSQFMQKVGRCVRTYPGKASGKVILIKNRSHKFLTRHFNAQKAILKEEYDSVPTRLDLE